MPESEGPKQAAKLLKRCDKNGDHSIDQDEFTAYYAHTAKEMNLFTQEYAMKQGKNLHKLRNESKFAEFAHKKWVELDTDGDGRLGAEELKKLTEWVYSTLHPGEEPTAEELEAEHARIMKLCDKNTDGVIDELEFRIYYECTANGLVKFKQASRARRKKAKKSGLTITGTVGFAFAESAGPIS